MSAAPALRYVAWETTRRCDQVCLHCVNASGRAAPGELNKAEAADLVEQLIQMGVKEVGLTGGESYLRRDIYTLIERLISAGLMVRMQTGGYTLTPKRAERLKAGGLTSLGVSVDGLRPTHDLQRGRQGSFDAAIRAIEIARAAGLDVGVNTQINTLTLSELPELCAMLRALHVSGWQVTLTLPAGRAEQHLEWILQPWQSLHALELIAGLQTEAWERPLPHEESRRFHIYPGSNVGYYGPHEMTLRSSYLKPRFWQGPGDGLRAAFISCTGEVRGSTFLPGPQYLLGHVRKRPLAEIWADEETTAFTRRRDEADLWGGCKGCIYADPCFGGDILTAEALVGRRGNSPHCWHRAHTLKKQGLRERLVPKRRRDTSPGCFTVAVEPWPIEDA